jgi:prepilin-type N-terminal cleavage/methylation domain-containing protein
MAMSTSSRAADRPRRAGFTLVETLVALVVAGLVLTAIAQVLSQAWTATRTPMDVTSAILLARAAAFDAPPDAFRRAERQGFRIARSSRALEISVLPSGLAPAVTTAAQAPEPHATPAAMQLAEPAALIAASQKPRLVLRAISLVVATPLGRRVRLDTIRAENAPE